MFERYESVMDRVTQVARRFQATRFWWSIAIIAAIASIVGWQFIDHARAGTMPGTRVAIALLAFTAVGSIAAFVYVRFCYQNPHWVANKIESRFPGLQQRLLTAVSQSPPPDGRELGYLQRRVITDAFRHSQTHRWTEAVPRTASWLSRLSGMFSLALLATVIAMLCLATPQASSAARSLATLAPEVVIEPGNVEIEKGSGLVISARFPSAEAMIDDLQLITQSGDVTLKQVAMTQSLADPLVSAYVPLIDQPFRYHVSSQGWQSETYQVEVFEYPTMLRADATLDYPAYTNLPPKRIENTLRVSAVEGTRLRWDLRLNKPMVNVAIRDKSGDEVSVSAKPGADDQFQFDVQLTKTQQWTIELTDAQGRKNKSPIKLDARVFANKPPELKLTQGGDLVASPLEELSLAAEVKDDFGIVRSGITYSLAGQANQEVTLIESAAKATKTKIEHLVALENLRAEPDQLLSYHFWTEDYAGDGTIRRTPGDLYFVEIRPFEEIFREGESPPGGQPPPSQQQGGASEATEELAELQKQIIAATWKTIRDPRNLTDADRLIDDAGLLQESQQKAIELAEQLKQETQDAQALELIATLTGHMGDAVKSLGEAVAGGTTSSLDAALTAEQAAYQTLLRLRAREFQVSRSQQSRGQQSGSASAQRRQQQLDELELKNDENRYETQSQATDQAADEAQSEQRETLNRLRELAQRQEDINQQLAQLQSAIEEAETEEEREEARRQLKRLREQEEELLRESDQLADRMEQQSSSSQERQGSVSEQLEQTRENLRKATDALENDNVSEALSAGTRAERGLDELGEEFRKEAAGQFDETMRKLREEARELEARQQEIGDQIQASEQNEQPGLRPTSNADSVQETIQEQREALGEILQRVQKTVEQAESAEPLLAQNLYDTYRQTQQQQLDERLRDTSELLRLGLTPEAAEAQQQVTEGTEQLRRSLEKAAESVLGDETKSLQRALNELEKLDQALQSELAQAEQSPNSDSGSQGSSPRSGERQGEPGQQPENSRQGQPGQQGQASEQGEGGQPGESAQPGPRGGSGGAGGMLNEIAGESEATAEGAALGGPIAGGGFRQWSDALRDVEEMVSDPALRSEASVIRDRARQMRVEMRRHSSEPQWELVETMIAKPLRELKMKVSEELMRRVSDRADPVPIDRDPVPDEYSGAVKRYYESLGSGR